MDVATCIHYTGLDPHTLQPVKTVNRLRDRQVQRALLQFFAPENYFTVRKALEQAGRRDLIGDTERCLIPASAPQEAIAARRERANRDGREARNAQGTGRPERDPKAPRQPGYRAAARERGKRRR